MGRCLRYHRGADFLIRMVRQIRTRQEHSYGCLWLFCENLDTLLREAVCYLSFVLRIHAEVCGKQIELRAPVCRHLFSLVPQNVLEEAG